MGIPLVLEDNYSRTKGWNYTLMRDLAASGLFSITTAPRRRPKIDIKRAENFHVMKVGTKLVGVDTWDSTAPTNLYYEAGEFHKGGTFDDLDLILKIQYSDTKKWHEFEDKCPIPVSSWTVFPNRDFPLEYFKWKSRPHKYTASFTGRHLRRFSRGPWIDFMETHADMKTGNPEFEDWLTLLKECQWGLILHGLFGGGDAKNRREVEYSSCGMPLALNYKPTYPFPMEANKHYVYIEKPQDLLKLRDIDPYPFVAESSKLYDNYFSPKGMSYLLLRLVEEKCR